MRKSVFAAAVALAAYALPPVALAADSWWFHVDCHDTGLENTNTPDWLDFESWRDGKRLAKESKSMQEVFRTDNPLVDPGTCHLQIPSEFTGVLVSAKLGKSHLDFRDAIVKVRTKGKNAFWIDRAILEQQCGPADLGKTCGTQRKWGVNGKSGWCISASASDSFGRDRQDGKCLKCVEFHANDETARACKD